MSTYYCGGRGLCLRQGDERDCATYDDGCPRVPEQKCVCASKDSDAIDCRCPWWLEYCRALSEYDRAHDAACAPCRMRFVVLGWTLDRNCPHACVPIRCPEGCGEWCPQVLLDCNHGTCMNCAVEIYARRTTVEALLLPRQEVD